MFEKLPIEKLFYLKNFFLKRTEEIKREIDKRKGFTNVKPIMEKTYHLNKNLYNQVFIEITKRDPKYITQILFRG